MSYFSHNPEAYDEIMVKAVTNKLLLNAGRDATEDEREFLECIISNLNAANVKHNRSVKWADVFEDLVAWAHEELADQEQAFWDSKVP